MARRKQTLLPVPGIHAGSSLADRKQALMDLMASLGHPIRPTEETRTAQRQAELYAQGRTTPGDIVTDKDGSPGKESPHQSGRAIDFAFVGPDGKVMAQENGRPDQPWDLLGEAAQTVGLQWGGTWGQPYSDEILKRYNLPPGTRVPPGMKAGVGQDQPHVQQPLGSISGISEDALLASNKQAESARLARNEQPSPAAGPRRRDSSASPLGSPSASAAGLPAGGVDNPVRVGPQRRSAAAMTAPAPETRGFIDELMDNLKHRPGGDIPLFGPRPPSNPGQPSAPLGAPLTMGPIDELMQTLRRRKGDVNLPSEPPAQAAAPPPPAPGAPPAMPIPAAVGAPPAAAAPMGLPPSPAPVAPPAAPEPAPAPAVPSSTMFPVVQGQGDMIRVGILPAMLGQEGTDPIVVTIPRATRPEDVQATAMAQAMANTPKTVKLPNEGPQQQAKVGLTGGPGQSVGLNFGDANVMGDTLAKAAGMTPQLAAMAAQLYAPASLGFKGAVAIPTILDAVMQAVDKGSVTGIDPVQSGTQGAIGAFGHGVGNIATNLGKIGDAKVVKALRLSPAEVGTGEISEQAMDMYRNVLTRESVPGSGKAGLDLTKEAEDWLNAEAQRRGLHGWADLADRMRSARVRGRVAAPRITAWAPEAVTNIARTNPRTMQFGQWLHNIGEGRDPIEAVVRSIMAYLTPAQYGQQDEPGPVGPRRRTSQ